MKKYYNLDAIESDWTSNFYIPGLAKLGFHTLPLDSGLPPMISTLKRSNLHHQVKRTLRKSVAKSGRPRSSFCV